MTSYQIHDREGNRTAAVSGHHPAEMTGPVVGKSCLSATIPIALSEEDLAWRERAGDLADWALENVVVRPDCYVAYLRILTAGVLAVEPRTIHELLTRELLVRHFSGDEPDGRVAVHIVRPGDEMCKVTIADIDTHSPDDDPVANRAFAIVVARRAMERGSHALVFDSNGAGGYHIWVLHQRPIPCAETYLFGKWLVHDWARHGLRKEPESFPKSPELTGKGFGTTIRLPGRHPKRDHWTTVWNCETDDQTVAFLRGSDAVAAILEGRGRPDRVPPCPPSSRCRSRESHPPITIVRSIPTRSTARPRGPARR